MCQVGITLLTLTQSLCFTYAMFQPVWCLINSLSFRLLWPHSRCNVGENFTGFILQIAIIHLKKNF